MLLYMSYCNYVICKLIGQYIYKETNYYNLFNIYFIEYKIL